MIKSLNDYTLAQKIAGDGLINIFHAFNRVENHPCLVKLPVHESPADLTLSFLRNDFACSGDGISGSTIRSKRIVRYLNSCLVEFQHYDVVALPVLLPKDQCNIETFLRLAAKMTELLIKIHDAGIIHRCLTVDAFVKSVSTGAIYLSNFYISSRAGAKDAGADFPLYYTQRCTYVAPEQTGNTDRIIDERSDLYSLGAILYEIASGEPPFTDNNPASLLYSHITRKPVPLTVVRPGFPPELSSIVLKLLEKNPVDRYQSAQGLLNDLEECRYLQQQDKTPTREFSPGLRDRTTRLFPVKALRGRSAQIRKLADMYTTSIRGCTSVALVTGAPGVGKTRLIDAFLSEIDHGHIVIARGKADSSNTSIPYYALKTAMVDFLKVIISQGNDSVVKWRQLFSSVLAEDLDAITGFLPEMQLILGPSPKKIHHAETEQGTRFKNALIRLLRSFLDSGSQVMFILDDLQWIDTAALDIIKAAYLNLNNNRFLLILSGRGSSSDYTQSVRLLTSGNINSALMHLETLSLFETTELVCDLLGASPEELSPLAELVYQKTGGNPFFVEEFVEMLLSRKFLAHQFTNDHTGSRGAPLLPSWKWDTNAINEAGCTDNLVALLVAKAERLQDETLALLKIASCIGSEFDTNLVASVICQQESRVLDMLASAIDIGIIQRKYSAGTSSGKQWYQFVHEGLREALYSKISSTELSRLHLLIGRTMLSLVSKTGQTSPAYEIVRHFNRFETDIPDPADRRKLSLINRDAALLARNEHAYRIAVEYCLAARSFLDCEVWMNDQELIYPIELLHAECEYLAGNITVSLSILDKLMEKTVDKKQLARIDLLKMSIFDHQQNLSLSLQTGFNAIAGLGIGLPEQPSLLYFGKHILKSFSTIRIILQNRKGISIQRTPPEEVTLAFRILCRMWLQAFTLNNQKTVASITMHLIRATGIFGECGATAVAVCFWGGLIMILTKNPARGLRYADYALDVARRNDDPFSRGIATFLYASFFSCYKGHIDLAISMLDEGKKISYEAGDIVSASNSSEGLLLFMALSGKNLVDVRKKAESTITFLQEVGIALTEIKVPLIIKEWTKDTQNLTVLDDHKLFADAEDETPIIKGVILFFGMISKILTGDGDSALSFSHALRKNPILSPQSYFYYLFAFFKVCALSTSGADTKKRTSRSLIRQSLGTLRKAATYSSVNFNHCYLYVLAEWYLCNGKYWDAWKSFRQAIEHATHHGFTMHAALIAERQAAMVNDYQTFDAQVALKQSLQLYREWGARAKADQLSSYIPDNDLFSDRQNSVADLDLQALMTSFEAISNELILDRLLEKLVRIIMENSGAHRGVLLLEKNDGFYVKVEGTFQPGQTAGSHQLSITSIDTDIAYEKYSLPHTIISFTAHAGEAVRLEDAAVKGAFIHDHYIREHQIKSVLSLPLFTNERTKGIVYLENNLVEGAFPPVKLRFIRLLCSQAIIAIENALFHDMEIRHLQSKVNPHFLFNALSSIAELCHSDARATEDAIVKLSTLYRYVLTAEMRMVTLDEELHIINKYLAIEKLRFGKRLTFDITVTGDASKVFMPSMTIQPLVENSIKHAISPHPDGGTINVIVTIEKERCSVTVKDSGAGRHKKTQQGTGYGLESIRKRLQLQYGNDAHFEINEIAGFTVSLCFPVNSTGTNVKST